MNMNKKYKLNELAKDLGLTNAEVAECLEKLTGKLRKPSLLLLPRR